MNNLPRVLPCSFTTVSVEPGVITSPRVLSDVEEGTTEYTTCDSLLNTSGGDWPGSSVFEIAAAGINLNKIVIGKPAQAAGDANNGYIAPATLATCVSNAKAKGWSAFYLMSISCSSLTDFWHQTRV